MTETLIETKAASLYKVEDRIVKIQAHGLGLVSLLFDGDKFNPLWHTRWVRESGLTALIIEDTKAELLRITGIILAGGQAND